MNADRRGGVDSRYFKRSKGKKMSYKLGDKQQQQCNEEKQVGKDWDLLGLALLAEW